MAEANTDEIERKAAAENPQSRGVALADESPDELPALLAIAVGIAILAIAIVWPTIRDRDTSALTAGAEEVVEVVEEEPEEDPVEEEPEEAAPEVVGPDIPFMEGELAGLGLGAVGLSAAGNVVTAEGVVADEAARTQVLEYVAGQPNVDSVIDALTIEAPAATGPDVVATAAQVSIILEGTVPDDATAQALFDRAASVYSEAQVDNRLVVDPSVQPPIEVTIAGSMTDPVLYDQVVSAFNDMDGIEVGELSITLEESNEVESSLNSLDPIQFASGSALVDAASEPILDQAAEFLTANPDVAVEIGGHTDSTGGDESNQTLSQARADTVLAALQARGVTNDMSAVGFGERRLKESPDENDLDAQRANRRIEFRITN